MVNFNNASVQPRSANLLQASPDLMSEGFYHSQAWGENHLPNSSISQRLDSFTPAGNGLAANPLHPLYTSTYGTGTQAGARNAQLFGQVMKNNPGASLLNPGPSIVELAKQAVDMLVDRVPTLEVNANLNVHLDALTTHMTGPGLSQALIGNVARVGSGKANYDTFQKAFVAHLSERVADQAKTPMFTAGQVCFRDTVDSMSSGPNANQPFDTAKFLQESHLAGAMREHNGQSDQNSLKEAVYDGIIREHVEAAAERGECLTNGQVARIIREGVKKTRHSPALLAETGYERQAADALEEIDNPEGLRLANLFQQAESLLKVTEQRIAGRDKIATAQHERWVSNISKSAEYLTKRFSGGSGEAKA